MHRGAVAGIVAVAVAAVVALAAFLLLGRGAAPTPGTGAPAGSRPQTPPGPVPAANPKAPGLAATGMEAATAAPEGEGKTGSLVVHVSAGGKPVAGAKVGVFAETGGPWRGETGAEGDARFPGLPAGSYAARADAEGHAGDEKEDVTVESGAEARVEIEIEAGIAFDGLVVDVRDSKPVSGVRIVVGSSGSVGRFVSANSRAPYDRTKTDDEGRFHVRGMPEGEVGTVEATAEGYTKGAFSVRILGGKVTPGPVVVRLTPGGRVVGVVRDPLGKPVEGAIAYVMPESAIGLRKNPRVSSWSTDGGHSEAARATTDAKGQYVVANLPLDEVYVAVADGDGFARSEEAAGLRLHLQRLEATADLALRKPAGLVVRLVDLDGKPVVEPAQVQLGEMLGGARKTAPDAGNEYRFAELNLGETPISVNSPSFRPAKATAALEAGVTTDLVVRLDPGAAVEGVVVDEDGKAVADAEVSVAPVAGNEKAPAFDDDLWYLMDAREAKTDASGLFRVGGLASGDVLVGAEKHARLAGATLRPKEVLRLRAPAKDVRLVVVALGSAALRLVTPDGAPYAGAAYVLRARHGGSRGGGSQPVKDGVLVVDGLPVGPVDLDVSVEGYAPVQRTFDARLRDRVDLGEVRLDAGVDVRGRVLDLLGNPLAGARVAAEGRFDGVAADARGAFVLPHMPRAAVRVVASADGFLDAGASAEPGGAAVEFRLAHGALVRGAVKGSDGKPAADTSILAQRLGPDGKPLAGEDDRQWDRSGDDGRVKWRLASGRWRFSLGLLSGEEIPLTELTLAEGDTKDLELTLPAK